MVTTVYRAEDGTEFDALAAAEKYEAEAESLAFEIKGLAMQLWEWNGLCKPDAEEAATWILKRYTLTLRT
jgi:hypothetical protein